MKINEIRPLESKFTEVLDTIALKPKILYYYGKMPKLCGDEQAVSSALARPNGLECPTERSVRRRTVAIVGTRRNTPYGHEVAYRLAYELSKRGAIIISGLALGCDSIAHKGALDAGGTTVAVFGTPIDRIHPSSHYKLAHKIVEQGGALISEYPPGARLIYKKSFLERNRLISGLADVVIVIEANERSGSINTASHALAQNRELWAVPGDITRPFSRGCNKLISQGANPVVSIEETVEVICPTPRYKRDRTKQAIATAETPAERAVLTALKRGLRDGDKIVEQGLVSAADFNVAITMLEIRGVVKPLGLNNWTIV